MASPTNNEPRVQFIEQKVANLSLSDTSPQTPKKPKKTLPRTISTKLIGKRPQQESPKTPWQKAKELWPSSTSWIQNESDYQKLRSDFLEIFPNLITSGEASVEDILEDIEWRSVARKIYTEWLNSGHMEPYQQFAERNIHRKNYITARS